MDTGTGMGMIRWHEQFLKNDNMKQWLWHQYDTPNEVPVLLKW